MRKDKVNCYMSPVLNERLEKACKESGISKSEMIRLALVTYLNNREYSTTFLNDYLSKQENMEHLVNVAMSVAKEQDR